MKPWPWLLSIALISCASAPPNPSATQPEPFALPDTSPVNVQWRDPHTFSEARHGPLTRDEQSQWVMELAKDARRQAERRLRAGERMQIEFIDIKRAGDFEPSADMQYRQIRVMRDIYPPRITLRFTRTAADGSILAQGERRLTDLAFLQGVSALDNDPLRYEKALLQRWLRRELPDASP